jgi:hypothetical protein
LNNIESFIPLKWLANQKKTFYLEINICYVMNFFFGQILSLGERQNQVQLMQRDFSLGKHVRKSS